MLIIIGQYRSVVEMIPKVPNFPICVRHTILETQKFPVTRYLTHRNKRFTKGNENHIVNVGNKF